MSLQKLPTLGASGRGRKKTRTTLDLSDPAIQQVLAEKLGIKTKPKANVLQRLTGLLGSFETGNAVYKGLQRGVGAGVKQYAKDVWHGITGALTGDVDTEKKTYSDVLKKLGVHNKTIRSIAGTGLDIVSDPTTYVTFGTGGGAKVGGKTLTKEGEKLFQEGLEKAGRQMARSVGKNATKEAVEFGLKDFVGRAAKEGIKLNPMKLNAVDLAHEYAEKRLEKFAAKTGAKLYKESGMRFAGKLITPLAEGGRGETAIKTFIDPVGLAAHKIKGLPAIESARQKIGDVLYPIRSLFSRTAEMAGNREIEKQYKGVIDETLKALDLSRYANTATQREAADFYHKLIKSTNAPEAFVYFYEGTPKSVLDKLPRETQKKLATMATELKQAIPANIDAEKLLLGGKGLSRRAEQYQLDLLKLATKYNDPIVKSEDKLMSSKRNIGGLVDLFTQSKLLADERTKLLKDAGLLKEGTEIPYMMRTVIQKPGKEIEDTQAKIYNMVKNTKGHFKKRHYKYLAELERAGGKTVTTGKYGKDAALALADEIGRSHALFAKAAVWKDLENNISQMTDELGNKILYKSSEIPKSLIDTGKFVKVKSPFNGKYLFGGQYMPRDVANIISKTHDTFFGDKNLNKLLKTYDKIQALWKESVTVYFPMFHIRNGFSNIFTNSMEGIENPKHYADAKILQDFGNKYMKYGGDSKIVKDLGNKMITIKGKRWKVRDLLDTAERLGVVGSGTFWEEIERSGLDKTLSKMKLNPTDLGNFIEDNAKLAHFIGKLRQGYGIEDAALSVKKALFDYSDLTDFEKNVLRRVVPFYTWARKNAEYQLKYAAMQPGKYGAILKGFRSMQDAFNDIDDKDLHKLPTWVRNGVQVIRGKDGKAQVIYGFGTPIEAFSQFVGGFIPGSGDPSIMSALSPMLKVPLELQFGRSIFTGKELATDRSAKQFKGLLKQLPPILQKLIDYKEVQRTTRQGRKYTEFQMSPSAKYLLSLLLGRGATTVAKGFESRQDPAELLNLMTGIKMYDFNLAEEGEKRKREEEKRLYKELLKRGYAKEYTRQYTTPEANLLINEK